MTVYGVAIFDLVGSRKVTARNQLQLHLKDNINKFNRQFGSILAVPAGITLGDEWQVLTHEPTKLYHIVETFQQMFWPHNIDLYTGIGIGPVSTILDKDIRTMDGPCFHHARQAVEIAKRQNHNRITSKRNKVFFFTDHSNPGSFAQEIAASRESSAAYHSLSVSIPELINVIIENNEVLKSKMTANQKEIYLQYLQYGSYRKIVEKTEKKSISNISDRLNQAEIFTIQRNGSVIESLLSQYCLYEGS